MHAAQAARPLWHSDDDSIQRIDHFQLMVRISHILAIAEYKVYKNVMTLNLIVISY